MAHKLKHQITGEILDRGYVAKCLVQALFLEPFIGVLLNLNKVRNFKDLVYLGKTESLSSPDLCHYCHPVTLPSPTRTIERLHNDLARRQ